MNPREQDGGIALLCATDGTILHVIRDELGLPGLLSGTTTIIGLMDEASTGKAREFLAALNERHAAFDCELSVIVSAQSTPLHFAGVEQDGQLVIVAARSSSGLGRLDEELMSINNEQTNALRAALAEHGLHNRQDAVRDSRLYDDLSRVNNELANLQRELVKKNVELEKLNEQKNRFLGMAAHDLRSPLGVILSYSEFLQSEASAVLSEAQREFLTTIMDTSEFMLRLVTDLLDVSAIEAGQLQLDRRPTDLVQLIRRNVTLNRVLAARKNIIVELDSFSELPPIPLDAGKIEQVLNNLISNAVKFSQGGTTVRVQLARAGEWVTVAVQDQGPGIPAADLPKLFEPFSKTSVVSTAGEQSTGLGLAIVQRMIEGHGGRIVVESVVGQGSTFRFTLPMAAGEENVPAKDSAPEGAAGQAGGRG